MKPFLTPWLTVDGMRAADRYMIDTLGLGECALMETAVRGAFVVLEREEGPLAGQKIAVVCGRGGNAGDGLGLARYALQAEASVDVWLAEDPERFTGATAQQWNALREVGRLYPNHLRCHRTEIPPEIPPNADLLVDALLGTGLSRPVSERLAGWVAWMNAASGRRIAIDVPSGLDAHSGTPNAVAVRAHRTLTMGAHKIGMAFSNAAAWTGVVHVIDLGIPPAHLDHLAQAFGGERSAHLAWFSSIWPKRPSDAHKYTAGTVLVLGGSGTYTGAPVLTSLAAARAGAGYVMLGVPERVRDVVRANLVDIPVLAWPTADAVAELLRRANAVVIGPGMEDAPETDELLLALAHHAHRPVVVDAGALSSWGRVRPKTATPWILTPHGGEWARLSGGMLPGSFAAQHHVVLVLKGPCTRVYTPEGGVYCAPSHPMLATAGSGDVLAGVMASCIAQGLPTTDAVLAAMFLVRETALYLRQHQQTMLASDLPAHLPSVLHSLLA